MTKSELESKHLAELHTLAAESKLAGYRMLPRAELIEKLADGNGKSAATPSRGRERGSSQRGERSRSSPQRPKRERPKRGPTKSQLPAAEHRQEEPAPSAPAAQPAASEDSRPKRRRRRRRPFARKASQDVRVHELLLPPAGNRQVIVHAATREDCTLLLREIAADLDGAKGPDPVVVLIEPSPEELVGWRSDAPKAEIVAAGQARHASDALAQARNRAGAGDDVMLLVDSLTRLSESYGDADQAKEFFDAGRDLVISAGNGSLTVVVAIERRA